jgi:phosphatidate phosphatase PAH1
MKEIKKLFPEKSEPFIGGLGNRENDAIAYYHAGIDLKDIFIIDTKSCVHKLDTPDVGLTYKQMIAQLETFFPKYHAMRIGY